MSPRGLTERASFATLSAKTYVTLAIHRSRFKTEWSPGLVKTFSNSICGGIGRLLQSVQNDAPNRDIDVGESLIVLEGGDGLFGLLLLNDRALHIAIQEVEGGGLVGLDAVRLRWK